MFPKERREEIVRIIDTNGHATVGSLAEHFGVSVDSIRKDLSILARGGLCRREYGGAFRVDHAGAAALTMPQSIVPSLSDQQETHAPSPDSTPTDPISESHEIATPVQLEQAHAAEVLATDEGRRAVAARAWLEINNGDAVFLGVSRTSLFLADYIAAGDKTLIVTTNMIDVLPRLSKNPKVTALSTGGYLNVRLTGYTGPATISLLEPLLFSKAFIGTSGINLNSKAVLAESVDDGRVNEQVLQNASYCFLLADASKFSPSGGYRYASITDFSGIITDTTDTEILSGIAATGTPVLCS